MLEKLKKRQELLDSAASTSLEVDKPSFPEVSSSMTPRRRRRDCLAKLASRIDLWIENDTKCEAVVSTKNDNNSTVKVIKVSFMNI